MGIVERGTVLRLVVGLSMLGGLVGCAGSGGGIAGERGRPAQAAGDATPAGTTCHKDDPNHVCLGLKYAVFKDDQGKPTLSQEQVQKIVDQMNGLWATCNISFQVDEYVPTNPADVNVEFQISDYSDLNRIRDGLGDNRTLLLASTGAWNRDGSLGNTGANAWTTMPGSAPYGAIFERAVETNAPLIAHEVGHYLGLDHADQKSRMMNPVIYSSSTEITPEECQIAHDTVKKYWQNVIR